jgi:hypothetical protein
MNAIIFLMAILFPVYNTPFCSCIGKSTVKQEVKQVDAILVGTIAAAQQMTLTDELALKQIEPDSTTANSPMFKATIMRYDLIIDSVYKGKITKDTVAIYSGTGGGDCGVRFTVGQKYIVYGEKETYLGTENNDFAYPKGNNIFWTYICKRTIPFNEQEITEIKKYLKNKKSRQ